KAVKGNQQKGKAKMGYAPVLAPPFAPKPKNTPTPKKDNPAKDAIYHQCGEVGHWRRNCPVYLAELIKKKKLSQGASTSGALSLYVGDGHRATVEVSRNNLVYFCAILRDDIFEIDLSSSNTNDSSMYVINNKRAKLNLDSTLLWHCRLRHINKKRMEKLQHDGLLDSTDIKSFEKCVSCMSGKIARKPYSHQVERDKDLLVLIHTDVCGPFKIMSRQGASYFITFTDDFSRYGYVYLLKHKHEVFEIFKVFQKEIENQLGKTIKSLRSDHVDIRAIRILVVIATFYDYEIWQMDVKIAFLSGYLNEETTVKNIMKYLLNTKDMFLVCGGDTKRELRVSCYTDVGYLTDADDLKSQTGYVFVLNGGVVDWKSTKQSIFATSSTNAKYIVAFDASKEVVWIRKFIFGLGVVPTIEKPINMYCDNTRAIAITKDHGVTKGARHFCAKVHYLRETIKMGDVRIEKFNTYDNLVDPFTKALAFPKHSDLTKQIGMIPASSLM
ncbi:zinc finger, CCHC-type containing protein, partial [Tanacetum coccineum]